jgi:RimJ/RimL family protein N-acetyltransferase
MIFPELRAGGIGTAAARLLLAYLFENTVAHRVEAICAVENVAAIEGSIRAGFQVEGTVRGAQWRQGVWRDVVLLSVLRSDQYGSSVSSK